MKVVNNIHNTEEQVKKLAPLILLAAVIVVVIASSFQVVDTGHRGIKVRLGKVIGNALPAGLHYKIPLVEKIYQMDTRVQKTENRTSTYSSDAQVVEVFSTLNYSLDPAAAHTVYQEVGMDWERKLILQILEGTIKEITGKYKAVDIISEREKATARITEILVTKLRNRSILVTNFELNNLDFDDAFEVAVKNKVIAVEQAKEAQNKTVRIKEESQQKIIQAQAEAESMRIRARALSQNKGLVQYEAVQKWNGKLPQYMLGDGTLPFIEVK